jgi:predicted kinase
VPLIAKDAIQEAQAFRPVAAQLMWELAAGTPGRVLLESWWFRPGDRGHAAAGLRRSGAGAAVEVWCEVPAEVARARFMTRPRGFPYEDEHCARDSWSLWAAQAQPPTSPPR